MKAVVLEKVGSLQYKEVTNPELKAGEALVKVMACGVCGSDIPRSYKDGAHEMPLIIGHEFAGIVESVGESVNPKWKGKRVGVFPLIPCKKCPPCLKKQYEMCKNYSYLGSRQDGGFAQYVSVPEWNLIELSSNVSMEAAAMLEPMAVAVHAMRQMDIDKDDTVVVCGLGTIGMLLTMFLLDKGIKNIYVIGNKDFQKKTVVELGINEKNYCDSKIMSACDFIMNNTDGMGADVFFECVGTNDTINLAVQCATTKGQICIVGNPHSDTMFEKAIYWKILRNQLTVKGTWNSSFYGEGDDWNYVLDRLKSGAVCPERFITHRFDLQGVISGMEIMKNKSEEYIKVMGYPNGIIEDGEDYEY